MGRGAWRATLHGVAESDTTEQLHFHFTCLIVTRELLLLQILHLHSNNGMEEGSGISHTVFVFVSGRQKHSQMHPAENHFILIGQNGVTWLSSKNLHSILTTFSFSFLHFKEESGCYFCVSVIHNRKNTYRKRSDTEGTLRTQDFFKFLTSF